LSKKIVRTVKITEEELTEFKNVYSHKFTGAAPVSDSALIRYMAIRGCQAMREDHPEKKK
jgi:hypothetical protein